MRYNARSVTMYGHEWINTGGIVSIVLWLIKKSFSVGGWVQTQEDMKERLDRFEDAIISRLERIEGLLMERRR